MLFFWVDGVVFRGVGIEPVTKASSSDASLLVLIGLTLFDFENDVVYMLHCK